MINKHCLNLTQRSQSDSGESVKFYRKIWPQTLNCKTLLFYAKMLYNLNPKIHVSTYVDENCLEVEQT